MILDGMTDLLFVDVYVQTSLSLNYGVTATAAAPIAPYVGFVRLPLDQMFPGHCVITPPSLPSVEYQVMATQLDAAVSSRTVESSDLQGDVGQASANGTRRRRANKTSPSCTHPDIGD